MRVPSQEYGKLRTLWRSNPKDKIGVYENTKDVAVAKTSPTCANYALLQTGVDKEESHPIAAKAIKWNFYEYDFAKLVATVEDAVQVYKDMRTTLKLRDFNLMKRICDNEVLFGNIPDEDRSEAKNKHSKQSLKRQSLSWSGMRIMTNWRSVAGLTKKCLIGSLSKQCFRSWHQRLPRSGSSHYSRSDCASY